MESNYAKEMTLLKKFVKSNEEEVNNFIKNNSEKEIEEAIINHLEIVNQASAAEVAKREVFKKSIANSNMIISNPLDLNYI